VVRVGEKIRRIGMKKRPVLKGWRLYLVTALVGYFLFFGLLWMKRSFQSGPYSLEVSLTDSAIVSGIAVAAMIAWDICADRKKR
jgi:hypothetical protein